MRWRGMARSHSEFWKDLARHFCADGLSNATNRLGADEARHVREEEFEAFTREQAHFVLNKLSPCFDHTLSNETAETH